MFKVKVETVNWVILFLVMLCGIFKQAINIFKKGNRGKIYLCSISQYFNWGFYYKFKNKIKRFLDSLTVDGKYWSGFQHAYLSPVTMVTKCTKVSKTNNPALVSDRLLVTFYLLNFNVSLFKQNFCLHLYFRIMTV